MKKLCDLPNIQDFEFIGVDFNRDEFLCVVKKLDYGMYYAVNSVTGEKCFLNLIGWKDKPRFRGA